MSKGRFMSPSLGSSRQTDNRGRAALLAETAVERIGRATIRTRERRLDRSRPASLAPKRPIAGAAVSVLPAATRPSSVTAVRRREKPASRIRDSPGG